MIQSFTIGRLPRIHFGSGVIGHIPDLAAQYGQHALLVTGKRSFQESPHWQQLRKAFANRGFSSEHLIVYGEPSPDLIDGAVSNFRGAGIEVVIGIGGGSVLDAAKAIAGLLPSGDSVMDFLEGVGPERPYAGPALPCIAVPTTAGTGSEATRNAVIGTHGAKGFKKSFRHELLVPQYALVDPDLLISCPAPQIAANAMDALTQLLESYVSLRANPYTDALAESGLRAVRDGLFAWYDGKDAEAGRAGLAYGALVSGICLAQTGLGAVHGLASPLGAMFPIPHGVVCGTLVAVTTEANMDALRVRDPENASRQKYARVGGLLCNRQHSNLSNAREALVCTLTDWVEQLALPRLRNFGVREEDLPDIVAGARGSSMKTNPIVLSDDELGEILRRRL